MKFVKLFFLLIPLLAFNAHKYYVSITHVDYVEDKESLQIVTRIFVDDLEKLLQDRYDESIQLVEGGESENVDFYIHEYLNKKINIKINGEAISFSFVGKAYNLGVVKCYLEIEDVKHIDSFQMYNSILFDLFETQQNIVKTNINSKSKSFKLTYQNANFFTKYH